MPTAPRAATDAGPRARGPADVLWAAVVRYPQAVAADIRDDG